MIINISIRLGRADPTGRYIPKGKRIEFHFAKRNQIHFHLVFGIWHTICMNEYSLGKGKRMGLEIDYKRVGTLAYLEGGGVVRIVRLAQIRVGSWLAVYQVKFLHGNDAKLFLAKGVDLLPLTETMEILYGD